MKQIRALYRLVRAVGPALDHLPCQRPEPPTPLNSPVCSTLSVRIDAQLTPKSGELHSVVSGSGDAICGDDRRRRPGTVGIASGLMIPGLKQLNTSRIEAPVVLFERYAEGDAARDTERYPTTAVEPQDELGSLSQSGLPRPFPCSHREEFGIYRLHGDGRNEGRPCFARSVGSGSNASRPRLGACTAGSSSPRRNRIPKLHV